MSLDRFHLAQADAFSGYDVALAEIRAGAKRSHWIWYIFPQIQGLGRSPTARAFALEDLNEACDYLRAPMLRERYLEVATAVNQQLTHGRPVEMLMGSAIDAAKLSSSLTLFRAAASELGMTSLSTLCDDILHRLTAEGYPPCAFTLQHTGITPPGA